MAHWKIGNRPLSCSTSRWKSRTDRDSVAAASDRTVRGTVLLAVLRGSILAARGFHAHTGTRVGWEGVEGMEALAGYLDTNVGLAPRTRFIVRGVLMTALIDGTARRITNGASATVACGVS